MPSKNDNISHLNKLLKNELNAINHYFIHSRVVKSMGLNKLAKILEEESFGEMEHAKSYTDRILQLKGKPAIKNDAKFKMHETIESILMASLKEELINYKDLKDAIKYFEKTGDFTSREIAAKVLISEEDHIDWLEQQIELIDKVGIENFLAGNI